MAHPDANLVTLGIVVTTTFCQRSLPQGRFDQSPIKDPVIMAYKAASQ